MRRESARRGDGARSAWAWAEAELLGFADGVDWRRKRRAAAVGAAAAAAITEEKGSGQRELFGGRGSVTATCIYHPGLQRPTCGPGDPRDSSRFLLPGVNRNAGWLVRPAED